MPLRKFNFAKVIEILCFCAAFLLIASAQAQDATKNTKSATSESPSRESAMESLVETVHSIESEIELLRKALPAAQSDVERAELKMELKDAEDRLSDARFNLFNVATDVDLSEFQAVEPQPFSLQGSFEDLMQPIIEELRRATEETRQVQQLRDRYDVAKERASIVQAALQSLETAIVATKNEAVKAELLSLQKQWNNRNEDLKNEINVLAYQIKTVESQRRSIIGETRNLVSRFFQKRGRNLTLAALAAVSWMVLCRLLQRYLHERTTIFRTGRSTATRLLDIVLYFSAFIGALLTALVTLMLVGDWVLVALITLVLMALIVTTKDAIPGYIEEIRLMLNFGAVRERERIVYAGVPWLVEKLSFHTTLKNPVLRGGVMRMPIRNLKEMISRPITDREPYFPCDEGDWVLLEDETYGRVIFQSLEMVRLVQLGGAQKSYSTEAFLAQNPQNFSHGFRIKTTIGIDYSHQPESTTAILENIKGFFRNEVFKAVDRTLVKSINVEFAYANTSSLDYDILFDVDGDLAPRFRPLTRLLQRIGVDACNEFGLVIPFQQVTIHRGHEQNADA